MARKVFVSGCFDMLHSGHVEFFREASQYGSLYVALGSDRTVYELKGRTPVNSQQERLFMVQSLAFVEKAFISRGSGILDFETELREVRPDLFVVNEDGNTPEKQRLCRELGIEYVILERTPRSGLEPRSTTALRAQQMMPYRIDLAGGWLDQPYVSRHCAGPVVTASLLPTLEFNERSGMATSTRRKALDLWGPKIPAGEPEKLARVLFCYDNPPGTEVISGSQDAIGLVFPGLAHAWYEGEYWPTVIDHRCDESLLSFVENALYLIPLEPRHSEFDPLAGTEITPEHARALSAAAEGCWQAILDRDIAAFGRHFTGSFDAQVAMFPAMMNDSIADLIGRYRDSVLGWKLSGAGGGGYLILVSDKPVRNAVRVVARRDNE